MNTDGTVGEKCNSEEHQAKELPEAVQSKLYQLRDDADTKKEAVTNIQKALTDRVYTNGTKVKNWNDQ